MDNVLQAECENINPNALSNSRAGEITSLWLQLVQERPKSSSSIQGSRFLPFLSETIFRIVLKKKPASTIVVICPSISLAIQQACVFVVEGFLSDGYWVNTFSSDNKLEPVVWKKMAEAHNVMVMTPQMLLNIMDYYSSTSYSVFDNIDILILDECHHVRKEHPYNKIMSAHRSIPDCKTQVIGFTASPTKSPDEKEGKENLEALLNQMQAHCLNLSDENPEIREHVPSAKEETAYADCRPEDFTFARYLGQFVFTAWRRYISPLVGTVEGVHRLPIQSLCEVAQGLMSSNFDNWAKDVSEKVQTNGNMPHVRRMDIVASVELLKNCNELLDVINDTGFEAALKLLVKRVADIVKLFGTPVDTIDSIFPNLLAGVYSNPTVSAIAPVLHAFGMNRNPTGYAQFPRFIILVKFLERFNNQDQLHGMIFLKTREGVYHLAKMLRYFYFKRNVWLILFWF